MNDIDTQIRNGILVLIIILSALVLFTVVSASTRAHLWNKCHPEFPVTTAQMWQSGSLFIIQDCHD